MRKGITILAMLAVFCCDTYAEKVYVVVNKNNKEQINREVIRNIYSDNMTHWTSGSAIVVFELPVKSDLRQKFSTEILNKSSISSQRDWSNRFINNTIKNQVLIKPDRIVARFVSLTDNAIGYVPESIYKESNDLRVVLVID